MRGNRVTAISGCGCGEDLPTLATNNAATTVSAGSLEPWDGKMALVGLFGGLAAGAVATSLLTSKPMLSKGKDGLVIGLGMIGGGFLGRWLGGTGKLG